MKKTALKGVSALLLAAVAVSTAQAASTVVVTPDNTHGWSTADTRPGGTVDIVAATSSPFGNGALQLTTNSSTTAKAQYLKSVTSTTTLASTTELAYSTQRVSGPDIAAASYQLVVDLNGSEAGGFTTFVFEPYQNGVVDADDWQTWDVDEGDLWSTRSFSDDTCSVIAGGGGAPFYTLDYLQENCPDAVVLGFGVNVGSNNPNYVVNVDGVVFNGVTYDFELEGEVDPDPVGPTSKDQCKNGGWKNFTNPAFKNQGQCVSSVANQK